MADLSDECLHDQRSSRKKKDDFLHMGKADMPMRGLYSNASYYCVWIPWLFRAQFCRLCLYGQRLAERRAVLPVEDIDFRAEVCKIK